jgi:hypothetical protein
MWRSGARSRTTVIIDYVNMRWTIPIPDSSEVGTRRATGRAGAVPSFHQNIFTN